MAERVVLAFGAFRLDLEEKVLYRDGEPVPLTLKALDTLVVLVERHPRLVTKDELFARVWPDTVVEDNNLAQYISLLRRVLADGVSETPIIETVPRRGYRFCPPVRVVGDTVERPTAAPVVPGPAGIPASSPLMSDTPASAPALRRRPARRLLVGAAAAALVLAAAVAGSGLRRGEPGTSGTVGPTASTDSEARLLYLSGRAALSQGNSDTANQARARADLERAVARDPQFAPAWARLAIAYAAQYRSAADGRRSTLEAAERAAETAIRLAPDLPESRLARADVLFSRGEMAPARQALEASRDLLAGDAAYWHLLGFVEQRQGHWRASEAAFARAFDIDGPGTAEWLAVHFLHLRQYADARRVLSVATASSRTAAVVPDAWTRFSEGGPSRHARRPTRGCGACWPSSNGSTVGWSAPSNSLAPWTPLAHGWPRTSATRPPWRRATCWPPPAARRRPARATPRRWSSSNAFGTPRRMTPS
jgi:DNA-binding winged helix-turn-helix (wHTH) protein/Tfp pilus assembly protein PilF